VRCHRRHPRLRAAAMPGPARDGLPGPRTGRRGWAVRRHPPGSFSRRSAPPAPPAAPRPGASDRCRFGRDVHDRGSGLPLVAVVRKRGRLTMELSDLTRRSFFHSVSTGLYAVALTHLLGQEVRADIPADLAPRKPHFPPKATSVIHLFMNGGPSQMDLFDPKPMLERQHGKPYFDKIAGEVEFIKDAGAIMRSPF